MFTFASGVSAAALGSAVRCWEAPSSGGIGLLRHRPVCRRQLNSLPSTVAGGGRNDPKGEGQFRKQKRRKGRPAWQRSPDDSPLRDGNRDRLIGLLTDRANKTLAYYLMETNQQVYHWWVTYLQANPIPRKGDWDEISGDAFLRDLLSLPSREEAWKPADRPDLFNQIKIADVNPRELATRVMDIRSALATEFIKDLQGVSEENSELLRETLMGSLQASFDLGDEASCDKDAGVEETNFDST